MTITKMRARQTKREESRKETERKGTDRGQREGKRQGLEYIDFSYIVKTFFFLSRLCSNFVIFAHK